MGGGVCKFVVDLIVLTVLRFFSTVCTPFGMSRMFSITGSLLVKPRVSMQDVGFRGSQAFWVYDPKLGIMHFLRSQAMTTLHFY